MRLPRNGVLAVWIFALTIAVRVLIYFALDRQDVITLGETDHVAATLADRGEFADPYPEATGPTAHLSPGFPLMLAAVYSVVHDQEYRQYTESALDMLLVGLSFALLPAFSAFVLGDRLPGVVAALVGALNPAPFVSETDGREAPVASLLFLLACWVTLWIVRRDKAGMWALSGAFWGLLLLVQPAYLAPLCAMVAVWAWNERRQCVRPLLMACLAAFVVLTPWIARNWLVFHELVIFRDNLGMELRMSFHEDVLGHFTDETNHEHPFVSAQAREQLRHVGEVAYNQQLRSAAVDWIRENPAESLKLVGQRTVAFWFPYYRSWSVFLPEAMVSLLAATGLLLMFRRRHPAAIWIASALFTFPILYYFIQTIFRYRYPIQLGLYLCGGYAVAVGLRYARLRWSMVRVSTSLSPVTAGGQSPATL